MHTQELIRRQAVAAEQEKALAIRLARIAGVSDPKEKATPELTATVRYGDPNLAALFEQEARVALLEEVVEKLEGLEISGEPPVTSLSDLEGIGPDLAQKLEQGGFFTVEDVREASVEDLVAVDGIGMATAKRLKEQAAE